MPHLGQHLFGGDAAVHHPDALGLAVLRLDLRKEGAQGRLVRGVAGENVVGERKAVGRHDERNDHLHAVWALVAAVAVPALVALVARRIGFEIRAGQIVEKDVEAGAEQILPALAQVRKQRRLVLDELVEAAIERVLLDQRKIPVEQIAHRALFEPQPVQAPLAAGIDKPIADQRLEDVSPASPFARIRQTSRPEAVELQLLIELAGKPARAPLPRPMQLHGPEPDLHATVLGVIG